MSYLKKTAILKSLNPLITVLLIFILYIILPFSLAKHPHILNAKLLFFFYALNVFIIYYLVSRNTRKVGQLNLRSLDLQEKINLLNEENNRALRNKKDFEHKAGRYDKLKAIIKDINKDLNVESMIDSLIEDVYSLIANNKGVCVFYLIDSQTKAGLNLFRAKKEDPAQVIKAKQGDIFDHWVLRHATPLLIEDIKEDFRFDLEKLNAQDMRPVSSLISCALISHNKFLGILRLDCQEPKYFSQDDLRLLSTICDLAAAALENAQLFQKTRDLAIHDELTGLFTKGYFLERLTQESIRVLRHDEIFSLLMLDIDYFKKYNDEFGHIAGDIVLASLSRNIVEFLKDLKPLIGRFGGEEFCIVLPHIDKKKAHDIAQFLRQEIEKTKIILRRQPTGVTASIGIASFPEDAHTQDEIILKADRALYEAKQKGRNRVCLA